MPSLAPLQGLPTPAGRGSLITANELRKSPPKTSRPHWLPLCSTAHGARPRLWDSVRGPLCPAVNTPPILILGVRLSGHLSRQAADHPPRRAPPTAPHRLELLSLPGCHPAVRRAALRGHSRLPRAWTRGGGGWMDARLERRTGTDFWLIWPWSKPPCLYSKALILQLAAQHNARNSTYSRVHRVSKHVSACAHTHTHACSAHVMFCLVLS